MIKSYKDLFVWQKAIDLVIEIYRLTSYFPKTETYGLISQIRRAVVSIPSNIAEGRSRSTRKDFVQFLRIAGGSVAELETQLNISNKLSFVGLIDYNKASDELNKIMRMLNAMITKLIAPKADSQKLEAGSSSR